MTREAYRLEKIISSFKDVSNDFMRIGKEIEEFCDDYRSGDYAPGIVWAIEGQTKRALEKFKDRAFNIGLRDGKQAHKRRYRHCPGFEESKVVRYLCEIGMIKSKGESAIRQYRRMTKNYYTRDYVIQEMDAELTHPAQSRLQFFRDAFRWAKTNGTQKRAYEIARRTWPGEWIPEPL